MIKQIGGLKYSDLTSFERAFMDSVNGHTERGEKTTGLSEKQIAVIENIYEKHFGD
jgi:hypothetical protein